MHTPYMYENFKCRSKKTVAFKCLPFTKRNEHLLFDQVSHSTIPQILISNLDQRRLQKLLLSLYQN